MARFREKVVKVLLAEAPYSYGVANIAIPKYFPLGLGYIASTLQGKGFEVEFLAGLDIEDFLRSFIKKLIDFQPRVVGISTMTPSYPAAIRMARVAKETIGAITVLGGNHATVCRDQVIRQPEVDYVVYGEGEFTMLELCQSLERGGAG
ncbi:cobalamin-dependent protein, partial [Candidatus Pacearchaeota archaeon]|nr:cobalamin-dependent protein [Candidatus Pacearchaeota archaeon]